MTNILRCMVYREGDLFVAACIDLTLASQANSPDEAVRKLECQISNYIKEAVSESKYAMNLINRKAPSSWFLKYYYIKVRSFFNSKNNKTIDMPFISCC